MSLLVVIFKNGKIAKAFTSATTELSKPFNDFEYFILYII